MYARDTAFLATSVGIILIEGDDECLARIAILPSKASVTITRGVSNAVRCAVAQLEQYFAGERRSFDLPLSPTRTARGAVLRAGIVAVPYGNVASYGAVARAIGSGPRAVGQACRLNPFPIVVPCHRIVGGAGHYSAGDGLHTKNLLLNHERERIVA